MGKRLSGYTWLVDALCKDEDPKIFMSYDINHIYKAKQICRNCPVKTPCISAFDEVDCIAGGLTLLERLKQRWQRIENINDTNWK